MAAALQDDRRQSVRMVKALEEELASVQAAALVRDVPPGQQELPARLASGAERGLLPQPWPANGCSLELQKG